MSLYLGTHKIAGNGYGINVVSCSFEEYMRIPHDPDTIYITPEQDIAPENILSNYLPLAGGQMKGGIKLAPENFADLQASFPNEKCVQIGSGPAANSGATIKLNSDKSSTANAVELCAVNGSQTNALVVQPNGHIYKQTGSGAKNVAFSVNDITADANGNITLDVQKNMTTYSLKFVSFNGTIIEKTFYVKS